MQKRTRRRFQYNLRFAFVVTLFAALFCSWYRQTELRRQELIAEVESLGGKVMFGSTGWLPFFPGRRVTDVVLPHRKTVAFDLER